MRPSLWTTAVARTRRFGRWAARRRSAALGHIFRGACYGIGTGTVSLVIVWVRPYL